MPNPIKAKHMCSETLFASTSHGATKRPKGMSNSAHAMYNMASELSDFNSLYHSAIFRPDPSQQTAFPVTPMRKQSAFSRAQKLETYLDDDEMVTLLHIFQTDVSAADAYLAIERDSLRKAWVARAIGK